MKIELNGIFMDKDDEGGSGRSVKSIVTEDLRNMEAYDSPGMQGSSYNDLGRSAVKIFFEGTVTGQDARTLLEGIWSCFKKGDPVEFNSDVSGAADITKVLIASFMVTGAAGNSSRYDYAMELREYKEPPEEPGIPGGAEGEEEAPPESKADEGAKEWADEVAKESSDACNELTGTVLDAGGKPASGVTVIISGGGREITVKTDSEGVYHVENMEPGDYKITIKDEGYEGIEELVTVGGESG